MIDLYGRVEFAGALLLQLYVALERAEARYRIAKFDAKVCRAHLCSLSMVRFTNRIIAGHTRQPLRFGWR